MSAEWELDAQEVKVMPWERRCDGRGRRIQSRGRGERLDVRKLREQGVSMVTIGPFPQTNGPFLRWRNSSKVTTLEPKKMRADEL